MDNPLFNAIDVEHVKRLKRRVDSQYAKYADEDDWLVLQLIAFYESHPPLPLKELEPKTFSSSGPDCPEAHQINNSDADLQVRRAIEFGQKYALINRGVRKSNLLGMMEALGTSSKMFISLETDFGELEKRMAAAMGEPALFIIDSHPYFDKAQDLKMADAALSEPDPKKKPKWYSKHNKRSRHGKW